MIYSLGTCPVRQSGRFSGAEAVELIERDYALQRLRDAVGRASQGEGLTVLVSGEAGIGKTSLVRRLVGECGEERILCGGCEALFSPRPLGPVYDMASAFDTHLQGMLGVDGLRSQLFATLFADLQQSPRTTLLILEDMHWADAATLDLVKYLARRIHQVRALLLLTYRDDELGERHPLRLVFGDLPADALIRVPLLPLSEAGVASMAQRSGCLAEGIFAATGGNPFFVTEILGADGVPATVRDAVLSRAARQPPGVRALLDLVAIVPTRIEISTVDAVLAPTVEEISAALASGLLTAGSGFYAYRHELARISMEQALPEPLAAALHARVLSCLEAGYDDVATARLVHHAAGAGDAAAVLKYAPQAAAEAISHGSHCEAATLYGMALAHAAKLPLKAQAELFEQRAYQCYLTDQADNAIAAGLQALAIWRELGSQRQEGHMLRWLSRLHWFAGRNRDAEAYADQAVQLLESLPADSELAWALSNRSQLYMLAGRTEDAVAWGTCAIDLAKQIGDAEVLAHALNNVGTALYASGDVGGKALLEQSLCLALERGYGEHVARAYANLTSTEVTIRDYPAAMQTIRAAGVYFAERDFDSWSNYVLAWQSRLDFEQGRWEAAATIAGQLITRPTVAPVTRIPALAVLARIRLRRGDPGASELLDEASELARATGELQRLAPIAAARAEAAWLHGDACLADPLVQQTYQLAEQLSDRRALGELGFWCWKLGAVQGSYHDEDDPYALQWDGRWRAAAAIWDRLDCPYMRAVALLDGDEASKLEALATFTALGACATVRRCREQLRQAGVRGVTRGPRATTVANPAGLTLRERHVMSLLAKGLSNAEIASRIVRSEKTVEHHISAILRKLEVGSRGEAVAAAGRLGLTEQGRVLR
ncbi:ATP-binding protein [Dyella humicola]|uniref:ATP-binding protein n=1 Tax=Dyella humicola TaxID=2992126 RepID=UPI0022540D50|nr:AAA family ATPase [Dyella humicola]